MNKIILDWILQLGDNGIIYWYVTTVIGLTITHYVILKCYINRESNIQRFKKYIFILVFFIIIFIRFPGMSIPQLHLDEAEWMITAITFLERPSEWLQTHLTNTRPLTVLPLITIGGFGLPIDYGTTRLVGVLMNCTFVYFIYKVLNNYFEEGLSIILCLPLISMMSLFTLWDYIAYNSEIPCILVITIAMYLLTKNTFKNYQIIIAGLIIGSIPHIKEQAVPTAVVFFILYLIKIKKYKLYLKYFIIGVLIPNLCYFGTIYLNDDIAGFKLRFNMMLSYSEHGLTENIKSYNILYKLFDVIKSIYSVIDSKAYFFMWTTTAILLLILNYKNKLIKIRVQTTLFIILIVVFYTIYKPTETYPHYVLFFIFPLFIIMSYNLGVYLTNLSYTSSMNKIIYIYIFICSIIPSIWLLKSGNIAFRNIIENNITTNLQSLEVHEIMKYREDGDTLAMWGWENFVYLDAMLLQGVRLTFPSMILLNYPQKKEYLALYEKDLLENNVTFFMDSTGSGNFFGDREQYKHENFGNMEQIIRNNYVFLGDYNNRRIYIAKERI